MMWTPGPNGEIATGSPCLVEVGSRCHGGEGQWLPVAQECIGFTQVSITIDVYTNGPIFDTLGCHEYHLMKAGRNCDLVSRHSGVVRDFPGEAKVRALPSFRSMKWECKKGQFIPKTIDCFTRPGCVQLVAPTEAQADEDMERLHDLEDLYLIDYSVMCPRPPVPGCVVIVDPFSTGSNLAALAVEWGYKVILVFSAHDNPIGSLMSQETGAETMLLVQHDNHMKDQKKAMALTLAAIEAQEGSDVKSPVLAIIPGAETGVELAEMLATLYGTRSNMNIELNNRRSKAGMQNRLRQGGVRSVTQQLCRSSKEVEEFYKVTLANMGVTSCVIKPNESMGKSY